MSAQTIGRYTIIEELGRGGMGRVYRAHDPRFQRQVAIKILSDDLAHDPQTRKRFQIEAQVINVEVR